MSDQRRLDRILDPVYLADLAARSVDDLHAMKAECAEVETEVSFIRRLAQARMDILDAERDRRDRGGSIEELVAALSDILADSGPRPGPADARLPQHLAPAPDIEWTRGLEPLVGDDTLARLPDLSDGELADRREQLQELEREVSGQRRALHEVMGTLELELAERIKAGQAG
jgi:anti-sigma-K factor RsiG